MSQDALLVSREPAGPLPDGRVHPVLRLQPQHGRPLLAGVHDAAGLADVAGAHAGLEVAEQPDICD